MRLCLVGHRGVGKTGLLQRLQIYSHLQNEAIPVYDLDREVEKSVGQKIVDIFNLVGEKSFRQMEWGVFQQLSFGNRYVISLGAGFPVEKIPTDDEIQIVWVKRRSDSLGRIFLDRPRLDPEMAPLAEFHHRRGPRSEKYLSHCDWIYEMPEGLVAMSAIERAFFFNQIVDLGGIFTLREYHMRHPKWWQSTLAKWGLDGIELRDDLLSAADLKVAAEFLPSESLLLTHRLAETEILKNLVRPGCQVDWPLELGAVPSHATIASLHERFPGESLESAAHRLSTASPDGVHQKLAVLVHSWTELEQGLNWQSASPDGRSFLPRSSDGRWLWYRLWSKDRQKINFIHDGSGEVADQPSLYQWTSTPSQMTGLSQFAAVLGNPVAHSYTPIEHQEFFHLRQAPVFAIPIQPEEWSEAFTLLGRMGLHWAAVTSPLKELAFASSVPANPVTQRLGAANTLAKSGQSWISTNTDLLGLKTLFESAGELGTTAIWGGGGTLAVLRELVPQATAYSVRSGRPRDEKQTPLATCETLIWAASPTAEPPEFWQPTQVIDLNYRDDSRAKEYCQRTGARYISGLVMFKAQAEAQRRFWESK